MPERIRNTPLPPIGDGTLISRSTALLVASVHDEILMMDVERDCYYGLDDIGGDIWRRLELPCRFGAIIDGLAADYDADRAVIAEDLRRLLTEMAARGVVTLA
jgi:hypothetical protein